MPKEFIDAGTVAALIGLDGRGAFLRRRADLERMHGFPVPLPYGTRTLRWRRSQVMGWLEDQGRAATHVAKSDAPQIRLVT